MNIEMNICCMSVKDWRDPIEFKSDLYYYEEMVVSEMCLLDISVLNPMS